MHIVYFASRVQGRRVEEAKGEERRGGRKKMEGRRRKREAKKKFLARQRYASTRPCAHGTRLIVPKERIFLERFRAVAKEIHR